MIKHAKPAEEHPRRIERADCKIMEDDALSDAKRDLSGLDRKACDARDDHAEVARVNEGGVLKIGLGNPLNGHCGFHTCGDWRVRSSVLSTTSYKGDDADELDHTCAMMMHPKTLLRDKRGHWHNATVQLQAAFLKARDSALCSCT
jgi:hypothetical protein